MANKRKTTTAIVAGVTAAALLMGGTFAWTSISQEAKNEAIVDINPGGRLHDDLDGRNKDVYVENFSSGATGVDIFARIRLDQYFEVGQDAGINKEATTRKVTQVLGTDINDVKSWETYIPALDEDGNIVSSNPVLSNSVQANDNWQWTLGNDDTNLPYYMPTFNKNKDSLAADTNGTYEGVTTGDIVHYDDFVKYGTNTDANEVSSLTQDATYDWDDDTDEDYNSETRDENDPIDSADVLKKEETHNATQISTTATVISMAEWLALYNDGTEGNETGNFWVYDTDGWAYWAQPIAPKTTTGLLLDSISMSKVPDDNWYYGINVVGQFATASDWEMFFAPTAEGGAGEDEMTENAKQLMELITGVTPYEEEEPDYVYELTLAVDPDTSEETTYVYAEIGEGIKISYSEEGLTDGQTPDITDITLTYTTTNPDSGEDVETDLTADQYTYTDGILTITDENLVNTSITVKDKNDVVSGTVYIEETDDGILILDAVSSDTVTTTVSIPIPVEFDATDLDSNAEGYVAPDISEIIVTRTTYADENDETGTTVTLEKGTQYTYTYDEGTKTGALTIIDTTLEGRIHVTDKNGVVEGDVDIVLEDNDGGDETPGSGDGTQPLILVDSVDVGIEEYFGNGATFTLSCEDEINGVTVENATLGANSWPENVTHVDNGDGTITVTVNNVAEAGWFGIFAGATLDGETINDSLQINLTPDLMSNGINILLPEGYAGGMSPGFGGTFVASSSEVTWSLEDNNDTDTSVVADSGFVSIGNNETAETITLTATSTTGDNKYGTYKLKIITDGMLSINSTEENSTITLVPHDVREDIQSDFTDTYSWTVSPESGLTVAEGGTLEATVAGTYTVTATSDSNSRVTASIEVTVSDDLTITVAETVAE